VLDQPRFFGWLWEWREIPAKRNGASQNDGRAKAQQNCGSENHDGMVTVAAKSHRQEKDSKQQHSLRQDPKSTSLVSLEVTYQAQIAKWLSMQPDFQFLINPGGNQDLKNSLMIGLRTAITF
jgi:carbohydrate-selective porin OprB